MIVTLGVGRARRLPLNYPAGECVLELLGVKLWAAIRSETEGDPQIDEVADHGSGYLFCRRGVVPLMDHCPAGEAIGIYQGVKTSSLKKVGRYSFKRVCRERIAE